MGVILAYSLNAGLYMLCLYLGYRLFLSKDNQHRFNRAVLLSIYPMSFVVITLLVKWMTDNGSSYSQISILEDTVHASYPGTVCNEPLWGTVLIWLFLSGMVIVGVKTVITWIKLSALIRNGAKQKHNGFTLVITDDNKYAPFSWMRYVVIGRRDFEENPSEIIAHECEHIDAMHWIDLMIAQMVCLINWFNPAAWLMRDELMLVHEYQADSAVIERGHNPRQYQMLLIKKAVGSRFPSLANSLNHSKLKKRITMMYKEKSSAGRKIKALALVPVLALAIGLTSVPAVRAAMSTISSSAVSPDKDTENPANDETPAKEFSVIGINDSGEETTVVIRGVNLGSNLTVSGGRFKVGADSYSAKSLQSNMTDGSAKIAIVFPCTGAQQGSELQLNVNGRDVRFDLNDFYKNAESVEVVGNTKAYVLKMGKNASVIPSDMKILYNGKEISRDELDKIKSDRITAISIDKQTNSIVVTGK